MVAGENIYAHFDAVFAEAGAATAFVELDGASLSYDGLSAKVAQYSEALGERGIGPGDRVTAQAEKSLEYVFLYLATLRRGAIFNPLNTAYTPAELDYFLSDAEPKLLVTDDKCLGQLEPIAKSRGVASVETLNGDGTGSLAELAATQAPDKVLACKIENRTAGDTAALIYTSGTTGRSKGAMVTHGNLLSNAQTLHRHWHFEPGDVLLHALPVFHVHGLFVALHTAFLNRSKILWLAKFDVDDVLTRLPEATVMMGVPTFYTRLLASPGFSADLCAKMRLFVSGSAPMLAETHSAFEDRTGQRILERYGMSEAGMITSNAYDNAGRIAGTVGHALADIDVRVVGDDGRTVAVGEVGTLEVCGPNVFAGYWRMPEKTKQEFRPDGYFITGDLATMDESGRVTIVGRGKDLIISGGFNIYPKEVELEIDALEGVGESAVIGVPHPDFGECVVAAITSSEGHEALSEEAVIAQLEGRLARFKLPKRVIAIDALPRNAMGKVQKAELRSRFEALFGG